MDDAAPSALPPEPPLEALAPTPSPEIVSASEVTAPSGEQPAPQEPLPSVLENSETPPTPAEPPDVVLPDPVSNPTAHAPTPQPQTSPAQSPPASSATWDATQRARATMKRVNKKEVRLAKIVEVVKMKGRITNDDIEKLLHVSDATATRYAAQLVKRGLLRRESKGPGARYVLVL